MMVAYTSVLGLPYENPPEFPGETLTGGPDGQTPILAVETERVLLQGSRAIVRGRYTPQLTATTTNPDLGDSGQADGAFHRTGFKVDFWVRLEFSGAGVDPGSGLYRISLPFQADSAFHIGDGSVGEGNVVGSGLINDSSGGRKVVAAQLRSSLSRVFLHFLDGFADDNSPWVWTSGDDIAIYGSYIADPASV